MVQGEKCGNRIDASCINHGTDSSSKRNGFMALQKHVATSKSSSKTSNSNSQNSSRTNNSNWGPFKDRNDFVNMHFS